LFFVEARKEPLKRRRHVGITSTFKADKKLRSEKLTRRKKQFIKSSASVNHAFLHNGNKPMTRHEFNSKNELLNNQQDIRITFYHFS